ncbi:N-acetylneuraminate synthase family protein [Planktothrix agardhii]|uniref:N-acetylneuraminate synthase family protein n=1 Tax=Planktothrix agardhii TaxID=1160 RepID=UPI0006935685|nr:N-acetylneuraminate synthase family protein [Planktothrix agardhii]
MIIYTGMATVAELDETVRTASEAIPHLRELFNVQVGLSDHTMGTGVAVASVALGATVIEKHFTLRRADGGVDSAFSMEPSEMTQLVVESERAWQALGQIHYGSTQAEQASRMFRRSLYVVEDMKAGDMLTIDNVKAIRPGLGLPPKYLDWILGKKVNCDIKCGTALSLDYLG